MHCPWCSYALHLLFSPSVFVVKVQRRSYSNIDKASKGLFSTCAHRCVSNFWERGIHSARSLTTDRCCGINSALPFVPARRLQKIWDDRSPDGCSNADLMRATSACSKSGVALRFPPHSKTLARSPTALLQTLPLHHMRRLGLRRQSAAATALWIVPRRLWKHWPYARHIRWIQKASSPNAASSPFTIARVSERMSIEAV